ncbi:MAG: ATP-dependent Clp protease ATP-binding subunit [Saprospiraceae bacterium]|nr:ATP-dependent Clp protease ATP-binding subunit [Saprospiraceae bacterium]
MPFDLTVPFVAFKLKVSDNLHLWKPLKDMGALQFGGTAQKLAERYKKVFQEKVLDLGKAERLLQLLQATNFEKKTFSLEFPSAKDELALPKFNLEFEVFLSPQPNHTYCIVPAIDLEIVVPIGENLEQKITTAIEEEFLRNKRTQNVQDIISTIWFQTIELEKEQLDLNFRRPRELEDLRLNRQETLVDEVAERLPQNGPTIAYFREKEVEQMARILEGKFLKNILLVGPSGAGKSAIVEELARTASQWNMDRKIWSTTASSLIKELTRETGWQDNLVTLANELTKRGDVLFVKNLSELFEVGQYEGNEVSIADYFQTFLSRGEVIMITECTEEEFARIELRNPNYLSLFSIIKIKEPEKLEDAIREKIQSQASSKQVEISTEVIKEVIRIFRRFNPYSGFPGKPIRFLESLILNNPAELQNSRKIELDMVYRFFCEESGMPRFMVDPNIPMNPSESLDFFENRVFGQPQALKQVVNVLSTVKTALTKTNKPIASFLMVGPTGVGKTELAKNLAAFMFGSKEKMVRLDMSEYSDPFGVMRLTGAGYHTDGVLTSAIRREPFAVLLFDEIEKAHPNFFDLLLQILSEGRLTDNKGQLVNFCSTVIMMTSNIGAGKMPGQQIGLNRSEDEGSLTDHFTAAVEKFFKPELFNRIDLLVPFQPLKMEVIQKVVRKTLEEVKKREGIKSRPVQLVYSEAVETWLAEKGYDPAYGARQLHRTLQKHFLVPLAKILIETPVEDKIVVDISVENDRLQFDTIVDALGTDALLEAYEQYAMTDMASELRKDFETFKEGTLYHDVETDSIILRNEILEKENLSRDIVEKVEHLSHMETLLDSSTYLQIAISNLEIEFSIECIEGKPYAADWEVRLGHLKNQFQTLKLDFLEHRRKGFHNCWIYVLSQDPIHAEQFYEKLVEKCGMTVKNRFSLWHSKANLTKGGLRAFEEEYYLREERKPISDHPELPEKNARLTGVLMQIEGSGASLYYKSEKGLQIWQNEKGEDLPVRVLVYENFRKKLPGTPHRKEFYKSEVPRRSFKNGVVKDSTYKMNREANEEVLLELIKGELEENFKIKVEEEIS